MGNYQIHRELICRSRSAFVAAAAIAAAFALGSPEGDVRAGELYTENFNSYSGTPNNTQFTTGLPVAPGGSVTGWSRQPHAVQLATGNWAPMFFNDSITTASTIAGANSASSTYRVTFQVAPGVYSSATQATTATDAVILSLLTSNSSTTLASGTFFPGPFANSASSGMLVFQTATFDYQGTGSDSGALNLRFAANNPAANRFAGTVDNVILQTTARWNNGTSGNWSTGANWLSGAAPVNTDLLVIGGTAGGTSTNDLSGLTAAGLEFASTAGSFTISGSAITLSGSNMYYNGVSNLSASNQTLATDLVLGGIIRTFNTVGQFTVNGAISDGGAAAGITKTGSGMLTLSGNNSYSGTTAISQGSLSIASAASLPGWDTAGRFSVASGATLFVGNAVSDVDMGTLVGTGNFSAGSSFGFDTTAGDRTVATALTGSLGYGKTGAGTLTFSASNSYTGATTVSAGTLVAANASAFGDAAGRIIAQGGVLDLGSYAFTRTGTVSFTGGTVQSGTITNNTISFDAQAGTVSASLAGSVGLSKTGSGTLTLSGSNTYSGATTISAGVLQLGAGGAGGSVAGNVANSGTIVFNRSDDVTFAGVVSGTGTIVKQAANILTLTAVSTNTGPTTINAGTLSITGDGGKLYGGAYTSGVPVTINAGATLEVRSLGYGGNLGNLDHPGGNLVINGGTLRLVNTETRQTSRGFTIGANGATIEAATPGVTRDFSDNTFPVLSTAGGTLTVSGSGNGTFSKTIPGAGGLTKLGSGTWTLSGSNTYSGDTTVAAGTLVAANASALGNSAGRIVAQGGVLDLGGRAFTRTGTVSFTGGTVRTGTLTNNTVAFDAQAGTVSAVLTGSAGLSKTTAGRLTLTAANTYAGNTLISGGTLALASGASLANSGLLKAGDIAGDGGTLDVTALGSGLTVANGQKLGGYGAVLGNVAIAGGAIVAPGGSIGTLTNTGTQTWGPGGHYLFEITNAAGTSPGTDWDLLNVTAISITATPGLNNQFVIDLQSLTSGTDQTAGAMSGANWDSNASYQWKFLEATSTTFSAANFDSSWFTIATGSFLNTFSGSFSVARGGEGGLGGTTSANALYVVYAVPEPGTLALAGVGVVIAAWATKRRRSRASS